MFLDIWGIIMTKNRCAGYIIGKDPSTNTHTHVTSASVYSTWLWAKSPISICKTHVSPMKHTPLSCLLTKKYSQGPGNLSSATFKHTVNINKQLQNNRICVVHHQVRLNCFFKYKHKPYTSIHIYIYLFISRRIDISAMNDSMMKSFQVEVPPVCPQRERVAWVVPWPSDRPFRRWCAPLQSLVRV